MFEMILSRLPEILPPDFRFRMGNCFHIAGRGVDEKGRVFFTLPLLIYSENRKGKFARTEHASMVAQLIYSQASKGDSSSWVSVSSVREKPIHENVYETFENVLTRVMNGEAEVPCFRADNPEERSVRFLTLVPNAEVEVLNAMEQTKEAIAEVMESVLRDASKAMGGPSGGTPPDTLLN